MLWIYIPHVGLLRRGHNIPSVFSHRLLGVTLQAAICQAVGFIAKGVIIAPRPPSYSCRWGAMSNNELLATRAGVVITDLG